MKKAAESSASTPEQSPKPYTAVGSHYAFQTPTGTGTLAKASDKDDKSVVPTQNFFPFKLAR